MGNSETKLHDEVKFPRVNVEPIEIERVGEFGSYNDPENPRPGYYIRKPSKTKPGSVFYRGKLIKNADAGTFRKLGQGRAQDKNHLYYKGQVVKN